MISEQAKQTYAGMYVLKLLDLKPDEGGVELPVVLPHDWYALESVIEGLVVDELLEIHRRKGRYQLTDKGIAYIGTLIEEAEAYIDEFDDAETDEMVAELRRRNRDVLRVRFLWGWYQGEFDDPVEFQRRRGMSPVESDWAAFLLSDAFYDNLALDL
ncbi:MAG: hypothetical protein B7733_16055 [Myxococcales bacterium FL481]|nr:MAG: hypothetical protein B7733_16055 [Myxococcales bacterium FL481]